MENPQHAENKTVEKVLVRARTQTHDLTGSIHLPVTGKANRRFSDFLNGMAHFVALTDVTLQDRLHPTQDPEKKAFIELNLASVEWIEPLQ